MSTNATNNNKRKEKAKRRPSLKDNSWVIHSSSKSKQRVSRSTSKKDRGLNHTSSGDNERLGSQPLKDREARVPSSLTSKLKGIRLPSPKNSQSVGHSSSTDNKGDRRSSSRERKGATHSSSKDNKGDRRSSSKDNKGATRSSSKDNKGATRSSSKDNKGATRSSSKDNKGATRSSSRDNKGATRSSSKDKKGATRSSFKDNKGATRSSSRDNKGARHSSSRDNKGARRSSSKDSKGATRSSSRDNKGATRSSSRDNKGARRSSSRDNKGARRSSSRDNKGGARRPSPKDNEGERRHPSKDIVGNKNYKNDKNKNGTTQVENSIRNAYINDEELISPRKPKPKTKLPHHDGIIRKGKHREGQIIPNRNRKMCKYLVPVGIQGHINEFKTGMNRNRTQGKGYNRTQYTFGRRIPIYNTRNGRRRGKVKKPIRRQFRRLKIRMHCVDIVNATTNTDNEYEFPIGNVTRTNVNISPTGSVPLNTKNEDGVTNRDSIQSTEMEVYVAHDSVYTFDTSVINKSKAVSQNVVYTSRVSDIDGESESSPSTLVKANMITQSSVYSTTTTDTDRNKELHTSSKLVNTDTKTQNSVHTLPMSDIKKEFQSSSSKPVDMITQNPMYTSSASEIRKELLSLTFTPVKSDMKTHSSVYERNKELETLSAKFVKTDMITQSSIYASRVSDIKNEFQSAPSTSLKRDMITRPSVKTYIKNARTKEEQSSFSTFVNTDIIIENSVYTSFTSEIKREFPSFPSTPGLADMITRSYVYNTLTHERNKELHTSSTIPVKIDHTSESSVYDSLTNSNGQDFLTKKGKPKDKPTSSSIIRNKMNQTNQRIPIRNRKKCKYLLPVGVQSRAHGFIRDRVMGRRYNRTKYRWDKRRIYYIRPERRLNNTQKQRTRQFRLRMKIRKQCIEIDNVNTTLDTDFVNGFLNEGMFNGTFESPYPTNSLPILTESESDSYAKQSTQVKTDIIMQPSEYTSFVRDLNEDFAISSSTPVNTYMMTQSTIYNSLVIESNKELKASFSIPALRADMITKSSKYSYFSLKVNQESHTASSVTVEVDMTNPIYSSLGGQIIKETASSTPSMKHDVAIQSSMPSSFVQGINKEFQTPSATLVKAQSFEYSSQTEELNKKFKHLSSTQAKADTVTQSSVYNFLTGEKVKEFQSSSLTPEVKADEITLSSVYNSFTNEINKEFQSSSLIQNSVANEINTYIQSSSLARAVKTDMMTQTSISSSCTPDMNKELQTYSSTLVKTEMITWPSIYRSVAKEINKDFQISSSTPEVKTDMITQSSLYSFSNIEINTELQTTSITLIKDEMISRSPVESYLSSEMNKESQISSSLTTESSTVRNHNIYVNFEEVADFFEKHNSVELTRSFSIILKSSEYTSNGLDDFTNDVRKRSTAQSVDETYQFAQITTATEFPQNNQNVLQISSAPFLYDRTSTVLGKIQVDTVASVGSNIAEGTEEIGSSTSTDFDTIQVDIVASVGSNIAEGTEEKGFSSYEFDKTKTTRDTKLPQTAIVTYTNEIDQVRYSIHPSESFSAVIVDSSDDYFTSYFDDLRSSKYNNWAQTSNARSFTQSNLNTFTYLETTEMQYLEDQELELLNSSLITEEQTQGSLHHLQSEDSIQSSNTSDVLSNYSLYSSSLSYTIASVTSENKATPIAENHDIMISTTINSAEDLEIKSSSSLTDNLVMLESSPVSSTFIRNIHALKFLGVDNLSPSTSFSLLKHIGDASMSIVETPSSAVTDELSLFYQTLNSNLVSSNAFSDYTPEAKFAMKDYSSMPSVIIMTVVQEQNVMRDNSFDLQNSVLLKNEEMFGKFEISPTRSFDNRKTSSFLLRSARSKITESETMKASLTSSLSVQNFANAAKRGILHIQGDFANAEPEEKEVHSKSSLSLTENYVESNSNTEIFIASEAQVSSSNYSYLISSESLETQNFYISSTERRYSTTHLQSESETSVVFSTFSSFQHQPYNTLTSGDKNFTTISPSFSNHRGENGENSTIERDNVTIEQITQVSNKSTSVSFSEDSKTNNTITEDSKTNNTITEDSKTNNTITEDSQTNNTITEDSQTNNTITEDSQTNNTITEDSQTNNTITEDSKTNNTITEDSKTNNTITDDSQTNNTITEDSQTNNTITEDSQTNNTITEDSQTNNTITENSQTNNTITEDSQKNNSITDDSQTNNTITEDSQTNNTITEDSKTTNTITEEMSTALTTPAIKIASGMFEPKHHLPAQVDHFSNMLKALSNISPFINWQKIIKIKVPRRERLKIQKNKTLSEQSQENVDIDPPFNEHTIITGASKDIVETKVNASFSNTTLQSGFINNTSRLRPDSDVGISTDKAHESDKEESEQFDTNTTDEGISSTVPNENEDKDVDYEDAINAEVCNSSSARDISPLNTTSTLSSNLLSKVNCLNVTNSMSDNSTSMTPSNMGSRFRNEDRVPSLGLSSTMSVPGIMQVPPSTASQIQSLSNSVTTVPGISNTTTLSHNSTDQTIPMSTDNIKNTVTTINNATTIPSTNSDNDIYIEKEWKRKRKRRRKFLWKMCKRFDFIGPQGKRCCTKSLKCFGDLPELLDEIDSYNSSEDQDDVKKQLVCKHIKDSMLCMGHAMALPACKNYVSFVNRKLNSTLSDVTDFHEAECDKVPRSTVKPSGQGGVDDHDHPHTNTAAIIGGVVGGVIFILLIIVIVLLCKRRKPNRPSTLSVKDGNIALKNGSSRYQNHFGLSRKQSEVYAEIDESSMHSNQSLADKRPLPGAPPATDNTGYLTPRGSRDSGLAGSDTDSGGYHVLQKENHRKPSLDAYEKLQNEEGEYINPPQTGDTRIRMNSQKPPNSPTKDENYHSYFVLEKENNNGSG